MDILLQILEALDPVIVAYDEQRYECHGCGKHANFRTHLFHEPECVVMRIEVLREDYGEKHG